MVAPEGLDLVSLTNGDALTQCQRIDSAFRRSGPCTKSDSRRGMADRGLPGTKRPTNSACPLPARCGMFSRLLYGTREGSTLERRSCWRHRCQGWSLHRRGLSVADCRSAIQVRSKSGSGFVRPLAVPSEPPEGCRLVSLAPAVMGTSRRS